MLRQATSLQTIFCSPAIPIEPVPSAVRWTEPVEVSKRSCWVF